MKKGDRILLLAGSAEALQIAAALDAREIAIRALVSEAPRGPYEMPVPVALIKDVAVDALAREAEGCIAIVDSSHVFDSVMTEAGLIAAKRNGLPFINLRRTAWELAEHAKWRAAPDVAAAMPMIAPDARVFSTTGWGSLPDMAGFPGARLFLRQTARHDKKPQIDFVEISFGTPPFDAEGETALFRELEIDTLICRNLGGYPSRPKLDAADALNLQVILIDRPPMPDGIKTVATVDEVLAWVDRL